MTLRSYVCFGTYADGRKQGKTTRKRKSTFFTVWSVEPRTTVQLFIFLAMESVRWEC